MPLLIHFQEGVVKGHDGVCMGFPYQAALTYLTRQGYRSVVLDGSVYQMGESALNLERVMQTLRYLYET